MKTETFTDHGRYEDIKPRTLLIEYVDVNNNFFDISLCIMIANNVEIPDHVKSYTNFQGKKLKDNEYYKIIWLTFMISGDKFSAIIPIDEYFNIKTNLPQNKNVIISHNGDMKIYTAKLSPDSAED